MHWRAKTCCQDFIGFSNFPGEEAGELDTVEQLSEEDGDQELYLSLM